MRFTAGFAFQDTKTEYLYPSVFIPDFSLAGAMHKKFVMANRAWNFFHPQYITNFALAILAES